MQKDAYTLILEAIEAGVYKPGDRLVESELAERLGVSRTPVREALQRLETQAMLSRDGRSLIVASLDHNQLAELYAVRTELEGLAARLAARHATDEEIRVLRAMAQEARQRGIERVFLQVDQHNAPALALYRRAGLALAWGYAYWRP